MKQLCSIRGFLPYLLVVFINAFVDLGHKIVIQNTIFKTWDGELQIVLTALINGLILLPFILLFTPSGFLVDRYPKPQVLRHGALAAVAGTALIALSYLNGWFELAFGLTLLLSIQSAIYSPAKYGYIRELVGDGHLVQGNAWVQAITILSILSGTFVFSALFEYFLAASALTAEAGRCRDHPCHCAPGAGTGVALWAGVAAGGQAAVSRRWRSEPHPECRRLAERSLSAAQYPGDPGPAGDLAGHRGTVHVLGDLPGDAGRLSGLGQGRAE